MAAMKTLRLSRTKRLNAGHLWIFSNELAEKPAGIEPGEIVEFLDQHGEYVATGYFNPHSLIAGRVLSRRRGAIDRDFLAARIKNALAWRERLFPDQTSYRLVFGESDLLPGLIVDRFADVIVMQSGTAGMDRLLPLVTEVTDELLAPRCIVVRNDAAIRKLEGIALEKRIARGDPQPLPVIEEGAVRFEVDPVEGQKTGFFLDQRENRLAFARLIDGGRGLDLCSYTGAWGIQLAARGAEVCCVDTSRQALDQVARHAELNGVDGRVATACADIFAYMEAAHRRGERFDFIVLDPPAFAKTRTSAKNALRAYQRANTLALSLLAPGALLATSSCSYHISAELFLGALQHAARALSRTVRVIEYRGQSRDHPGLLGMPETRYLKCVLVQAL
jgi:23S rRNA (cytosine1962-C5)-methyltransferase